MYFINISLTLFKKCFRLTASISNRDTWLFRNYTFQLTEGENFPFFCESSFSLMKSLKSLCMISAVG